MNEMVHDENCKCPVCSDEPLPKEMLEDMQASIDKHGHIVIGMQSPDGRGNYAYTVGLSRDELPELLVIGSLPIPFMHDILSAIITHWRATDEVVLGRLEHFLSSNDGRIAPVGLRRVSSQIARTEYMQLTSRYFGLSNSFPVVQVCLPDNERRLPGEEGYNNQASEQRILPSLH